MNRILTDLGTVERSMALERIEEIFFLSSAGGGTLLGSDRDDFYRRWTGYYLDQHAELVLLAEADGTVVGYLMGCDRSAPAARLYDDLFYYRAFEDCYADYPAHLHINVHPGYRDGGIGASLVTQFIEICRAGRCAGVHVVTAAGARNRNFYERLDYQEISGRRVEERDLVLLGRKISKKGNK